MSILSRFACPLHNSTTPSSRVALFFCNDTASTEIYTLSLHDALPIYLELESPLHLNRGDVEVPGNLVFEIAGLEAFKDDLCPHAGPRDDREPEPIVGVDNDRTCSSQRPPTGRQLVRIIQVLEKRFQYLRP